MRAALTLKGNALWPAQAKARALGADRLGWETDNPFIDPKSNGNVNVLEAVRANGFTLFLFRALWGWTGSPEGWADAFKADLGRLDLLSTMSDPNPAKRHPARQCALDADLEVDDSAWVLAALKRLRANLPGRGLTWSMQPHKGGIISDQLRDFINNDTMVTVAPFTYLNDMQPVSERWVVDDLLDHGIKREKILVYYGSWCENWNGFLYDLDQIA